MQQNKTALIWFTNNLRIIDNSLLFTACENYNNVIAIYCFDPNHFKKNEYGFLKTEKFRAQFLIESVTNLKENLKKIKYNLTNFF